MADRREPKLGTVVQKALASGPVPRDALLQAVQQAGLRRIDFGLLWETCVTHGIADLDGELWVPRGRAAPVAEGPRGRSPRQNLFEGHAAAVVRRPAEAADLPAVEPVPPVGPSPQAGPRWPRERPEHCATD